MLFGMVISLHSGMVSAQKVTIDVKKASLVSVLEEIKRQTGYRYLFVGDQVREVTDITLSMKDQPVETVLDSCLRNTIWTYAISDKTIVLSLRAGTALSKSKQPVKNEVVGIVKDKKGVPMIGVTVKLVNTALGISTNSKGFFKLLLPVKNGSLECSFIGYKTQKVEFTEKSDTLRIVMKEDVTGLNEVQVIAYGQQKKRTMVSAVSSVRADDIKELPTHSLENLLQGHMAGVEVNNLSGAPGGGGSIVAIRGYNSFFTQEEGGDRGYGTPLYVVDGVPMQAFTSPITGTNTLSNLDPSMIESVEVLKDAASAAIYGSRAGNGVILITTKKGRAGKAKFTANMSYSASWLPETPVQSGGQLERYYNIRGLRNTVIPYQDQDGHWKIPTSYEEVWNFRGSSTQPVFDWFWGSAAAANGSSRLQDSLNAFYNNSTDWWRYAYRTAKVYNANIQASGGTEAIRYMIGAGYYKEEGIMYDSDFQRINVMTNVSAHPAKRLRLDNQLSLTYSDRSRGGSKTTAKIEGVTVNPMYISSLYPGASYIKKELLDRLNSVEQKNHSYAARYNLVLDYEIIRNLHLRVSGGVDYSQENMNHFEPSTYEGGDYAYYHWSRSKGNIGRSISLLNENLLNYSFSFKETHNFEILLGLSYQKDQGFSNGGSAIKGPNDYVHYVQGQWGNQEGLVNKADPKDPTLAPIYESAFQYSSDFEEERMNSYFGRLTYNFKEKYMFETTIRRDGSSVFGEKVRWATFPSVAVGWAFSEESWMKGLYWLSFGKIRASWGTSGQKFRQRYLAHGLMTSSDNMFQGTGGIVPDRQGGVINRKLTWEETNQYDLGLDISFWDYRIRLTCDYYYRYTKGQLNKTPLPGDVYFHSFQWQNALGVSNQGLELELVADFFRESAVKWRMKFNASRNWNRFEKSYDGWDFEGNVLGKPLYRMRVYKTDGFFNSMKEIPYSYTEADGMPKPLHSGMNNIFFPGTRRIIDLNGDGKINNKDKYYAASPLPLAYGGFINEITWRQFDLNIFFNYSLGRHIINAYRQTYAQPSSGEGPVMGDVRKFNAWTHPDGKPHDFPRLQIYNGLEGQYSGTNDCDIEKVHMIRLKQLTLGYNLHEKLAKKAGLSGVRVFLTMENLFLLTNYSGLDPEIVNITSGLDNLASYPLPRKFTVGLTINF